MILDGTMSIFLQLFQGSKPHPHHHKAEEKETQKDKYRQNNDKKEKEKDPRRQPYIRTDRPTDISPWQLRSARKARAHKQRPGLLFACECHQ